MNKFSPTQLFILFIAFTPAIYLAFIYSSLPDIVATHFDFSGKADRYGNKSAMIFDTALLTAVALGIYLLIKYLPSIDPKKSAALSAATFQKIALAVVLLLSLINIFLIYAGSAGKFNMNRLLNPLLGIFFMVVGNLMHSIKPNYFVGIRVPWTLEDPDNWRATHRLGSRVWFAGGALLTVLALALPPVGGEVALMAITAILVLVPVTYSYLYFRNHKHL